MVGHISHHIISNQQALCFEKSDWRVANFLILRCVFSRRHTADQPVLLLEKNLQALQIFLCGLSFKSANSFEYTRSSYQLRPTSFLRWISMLTELQYDYFYGAHSHDITHRAANFLILRCVFSYDITLLINRLFSLKKFAPTAKRQWVCVWVVFKVCKFVWM
jgi:hypothetical protein